MADKIIASLFLLGSLAYLFFARHLAFGTISLPKSGFLPMIVGVVGLVLALLIVVSQWGSGKSEEPEKIDWTTFIFISIGFLFYIVILNSIGYFAATFIFLFYLFKVADMVGWIVPLILAGSSSCVLYLLFNRFLGLMLP